MSRFKIVEKKNPLAVHALCDTRAGAQRWLDNLRVSSGHFVDKSLTVDSFAIVEDAKPMLTRGIE